MEEKNRIASSGTEKRTRKKKELSLSERLSRLAEERAVEARYAESYRARLIERLANEGERHSTELTKKAESLTVTRTYETDAIPSADATDTAVQNEETRAAALQNCEPTDEALQKEDLEDNAVHNDEPTDASVSFDEEISASGTAEDEVAVSEPAICESEPMTDENAPEESEGEGNTEKNESVHTTAEAEGETADSADPINDDLPKDEFSETPSEKTAENGEPDGTRSAADNKSENCGEKCGNKAPSRPYINGFIAIPIYQHPTATMPFCAPLNTTVTDRPSGACGVVAPYSDGGEPVSREPYAAPLNFDPAIGAVTLGDAYGAPINAAATPGELTLAEAYGASVNTDPALGAVSLGEQYGMPLSAEPTSCEAVTLGESYGAMTDAEPTADAVSLGEVYGTTTDAEPTADAVALSEVYGTPISMGASVDEVDIGEQYSAPISVDPSNPTPVSLSDGYISTELTADPFDTDRLLHERSDEESELNYSTAKNDGEEELAYLSDIDLRPSAYTMDTIDLATDKIEENVILVEERLLYEIRMLKRSAKMHSYTFALDSGAHYATARAIKKSVKRRAAKLSKAKRLEKKAARRYYLATLDRYVGDVKKRKRNRELISSILRRLEFLMEERSRINQRLIQLYSGKQYGEGDKKDLGTRQFNLAARSMYKKQKREARYVSRLYVERDVKERIFELMNERTECVARIAFIRRRLRTRGLAGDRKRKLKTEFRELSKKQKYLKHDIRMFIKKAEAKHDHNSADRLQRIIIGALLFTVGICAAIYLGFKAEIDAFISGLF